MPTLLPTNLFGLTAKDSLTELRRRYYDLALLCHPDRGGTATDMRIVQRSYEAAKVALEHQAEGGHGQQDAWCRPPHRSSVHEGNRDGDWVPLTDRHCEHSRHADP